MNLESWYEDCKKECLDIKKRPSLYLFRAVALLCFGLTYFIILNPLFDRFFDRLTNLMARLGLTGLAIIVIGFAVKKMLPETISLLLSGDLITRLDKKEDAQRVMIFYMITLVSFYLLRLFGKQVYESLMNKYVPQSTDPVVTK